MAVSINSDIFESAIRSSWINSVLYAARGNAYTIYNPPYAGGEQCVPSSMLGDVYDRTYYLGSSTTPITASVIYNMLVNATNELMKIGTFSFIKYIETTAYSGAKGTEVYAELSGRCIFNNSYGYRLNSVGNPGVSINLPITANSINQLISNTFNSWNSSTRYHYENTGTTVCHRDYCYGNCHSNCHGNCHGNCVSIPPPPNTHSNSVSTTGSSGNGGGGGSSAGNGSTKNETFMDQVRASGADQATINATQRLAEQMYENNSWFRDAVDSGAWGNSGLGESTAAPSNNGIWDQN